MKKFGLSVLLVALTLIPIVNAANSDESWVIKPGGYDILSTELNKGDTLAITVSSNVPIEIMLVKSEEYVKFLEGGKYKYIVDGSASDILSKSYEYNALSDDTYYIIVLNNADEDAYVSLATDVIVPEMPLTGAQPAQPAETGDVEYSFLEGVLGDEFEDLDIQQIKDLFHQKKDEIIEGMEQKSTQKQEGRLNEVWSILTEIILSFIGYLFIIAVIIALPIAVPLYLLSKSKALNHIFPHLSVSLNKTSLLALFYVPIGIIFILFFYGFALLFYAQQWILKIIGSIANPSLALINGVLSYLIDKSDEIIVTAPGALYSFIEGLSENQSNLESEIQKLIDAGMPGADVLPYAIELYNNLQGIGDVIEGILILSILVLFFTKATPTLKEILKFPIEKIKNPELKLSDFVKKISNSLKLELKFLVVLPFIMLLITIPAVIIMDVLFSNTIPILQQDLAIGFIIILVMFLLITILTLSVIVYLSLLVRDKLEKKIAFSNYKSTIKTTGIFVGVLVGTIVIFASLSGYIHPILPLVALNILLYKMHFISGIKNMFKFKGINIT